MVERPENERCGSGVTIVDARGLRCPLPLLRTKEAVRKSTGRASVVILATDPEAPIDIAAWCFDEGHEFAAEELLSGDAVHAIVVRPTGESRSAAGQ